MPETRKTKPQKKYIGIGKSKKKIKSPYQDDLKDGDSQYKMTFQQWKKERFRKVVDAELNRIKKTNAKQEGLSISEYWSALTAKQKKQLLAKAKSNILGKKKKKQKKRKKVSVWTVRG